MTQIIEFKEAYPNYEYGFMGNNELTATEKLLGRKSCLTFDTKHKMRIYQTYFLPDELLQSFLNAFQVEKEIKNFHLNLKNGRKVHFVATRRVDALYGVCLETHERVSFEKGFKVAFTK